MATIPCKREIVSGYECGADRFDEVFLHVTKGRGAADGYFCYDDGEARRFLLLRNGQPFSAAVVDDGSGGTTALREFFEPFLSGACSLTFCEADAELVESVAAAWQRSPDAHVSKALVDPSIVVRSLTDRGVRALVRLRSGQAYSYALVDGGEVQWFHAGGPDAEPAVGHLPSARLATALERRRGELDLDIYLDPHAQRSDDWAVVPPDYHEGMVRFYCTTAPQIVVSLGGREVKRIRLRPGDTTVGRDAGNDLMIDNLSVSRQHAVFTFVDGRCSIEDLGSSNGTIVGGRRIESAELLADGQEAIVGKHSLRFVARATLRDKPADSSQMDSTVFMRVPQFSQREEPLEGVLTVGGRTVRISRTPWTIGSDSGCDLQLRQWGVRPLHAQVERDAAGQLWITHQGGAMSSTRVNGLKMKTSPLRSGDDIQVGSASIRFRLLGERSPEK